MIGHHLTPTSNLDSIMTKGLQPCTNPSLVDASGLTTPVVWLWRDLFTCPEDDLTGRVLNRCQQHKTWQITALEVQYGEADLVGKPNRWDIFHRLSMKEGRDPWVLHDRVLVHCVTVPIPVTQLRPVASWDMAGYVMSTQTLTPVPEMLHD